MPWNKQQKAAYDKTERGKVRKKIRQQRYFQTENGKQKKADQQRRYRARKKLLRGPVKLGRPKSTKPVHNCNPHLAT